MFFQQNIQSCFLLVFLPRYANLRERQSFKMTTSFLTTRKMSSSVRLLSYSNHFVNKTIGCFLFSSECFWLNAVSGSKIARKQKNTVPRKTLKNEISAVEVLLFSLVQDIRLFEFHCAMLKFCELAQFF